MRFNIRTFYLYLFSFVGLLFVVIGAVELVDLSLRTYVFKSTETSFYRLPVEGEKIDLEEQKKIDEANNLAQKQRQAANSLAMIIVGTPLYLYHWQKLKETKKN